MRLLLLAGLIAFCTACAKPAWIRPPDFSSWFNDDHAIPLLEVARANNCGTSGAESRVQLFKSLAGLEAWAASRQITLLSTFGQALPESPYAVVEHGQRDNSGYGLAVSSEGGLHNDTLLVRATFFEPKQGRWASDQPSSPCVMVSLPARAYDEVKVIDQTGKVRAAAAGTSK